MSLNSETFDYNSDRRKKSTLALFVARIGTDDPDYALAADDLAVAAKPLDGSMNFHDFAPVS